MSTVSVTNNFVAGTSAVASAVNTNFADIVSYVNTNAVVKDGTKSFTAHQATSAGDPIDPTHLARKGYIDNRFNANTGCIIVNNTPPPLFLSATNLEVAIVASPVAIPLNATNPTVCLMAFADMELVSNIGPPLNSTEGSFAMNIEFSWDNGVTWIAGGQTSGVTKLASPGGQCYGGMSLTGFVTSVPATAQIVKARLLAVHRGSTLGTLNTASPRLTLQITRQVSFA